MAEDGWRKDGMSMTFPFLQVRPVNIILAMFMVALAFYFIFIYLKNNPSYVGNELANSLFIAYAAIGSALFVLFHVGAWNVVITIQGHKVSVTQRWLGFGSAMEYSANAICNVRLARTLALPWPVIQATGWLGVDLYRWLDYHDIYFDHGSAEVWLATGYSEAGALEIISRLERSLGFAMSSLGEGR